jgi:hypothetical protein
MCSPDPERPVKASANPPLHAVEAFITSLSSANEGKHMYASWTCSSLIGMRRWSNHTLTFPVRREEQDGHQVPAIEPCDTLSTSFGRGSLRNFSRWDYVSCTNLILSLILIDLSLTAYCLVQTSDYTSQLFSHLPQERMSTFSCGHIIPSENLQAVILGSGPTGKELEFKFANRGDDTLLTELGQIILNLMNVVPRGMIVFLPSYAFLDEVMKMWKRSGAWEKMGSKKKVCLLLNSVNAI